MKPFPFAKFGSYFVNRPKNGLSFFQHITSKEVESFYDRDHLLSYVDQRNFSIDSTLQFKEHLCIKKLK